MILWVAATIGFIVLVNNAAVDETRAECIAEATTQLERDLCDPASSIAAATWTVIAVVLGTIGFFVLAVIWFATRPRRHCQACGTAAKKGITRCRKCGHDFAAAQRATFPPPPPPGAATG